MIPDPRADHQPLAESSSVKPATTPRGNTHSPRSSPTAAGHGAAGELAEELGRQAGFRVGFGAGFRGGLRGGLPGGLAPFRAAGAPLPGGGTCSLPCADAGEVEKEGGSLLKRL